jgi:hypothetical protein
MSCLPYLLNISWTVSDRLLSPMRLSPVNWEPPAVLPKFLSTFADLTGETLLRLQLSYRKIRCHLPVHSHFLPIPPYHLAVLLTFANHFSCSLPFTLPVTHALTGRSSTASARSLFSISWQKLSQVHSHLLLIPPHHLAGGPPAPFFPCFELLSRLPRGSANLFPD